MAGCRTPLLPYPLSVSLWEKGNRRVPARPAFDAQPRPADRLRQFFWPFRDRFEKTAAHKSARALDRASVLVTQRIPISPVYRMPLCI
jgi:hypothetical protein